MAGNRKFHNKYHSANHHTLPSPHIRDSGLDPIASHEFPFIGDFVLNGTLSASNNYMLNNRALADTLDTVPHGVTVPEGWHVLRDSTYVDGDLTITGNLSALGETTYLHTQVHATSATEIEVYANNSNGVTAGLTVDQWGTNDVVHFKNDGQSVFYITGNKGGVFGDAKDGGNIGIGLDRLTPDPEDPKTYEQLANQAMTLVGSLSVVPDPNDTNTDQELTTPYQLDPGRSGSIYVQGGLHVNEHTFLDQVTIDTTDGPFVVSGGDNTSTANIFEVEVPTELDQVTIDTTDGVFKVEGTNKILVDNKDTTSGVSLDVKHHARFEQVTIVTSPDQPFFVTGNGGFEIDTIDYLEIGSETRLNKTTVNVNDGRFYIWDSKSTGTNDKRYLDVDCPSLLDQVTVNTFDGEFLITNSSTGEYVDKNPLKVEVPAELTKVTVDTSNSGADMTVQGSNKLIVTTAKNSLPDGIGLEARSHTYLNQLTVDTNKNKMLVTSSGTENILDVEIPTELDITTIDVQKGDFVIQDTNVAAGNRTHQMFVDTDALFERDIIFNLEDNVSTLAITGAGGEFYVNTSTTRFESHVEFDRTDVTYTLGQGNEVTYVPDIDGSGKVSSFVPFDLLNTTLSASNVSIRTGGSDSVNIYGTGTLDVTTDVNIVGGNTLFVEGAAVFELTGDYSINDNTVTDYNAKSYFVSNVPTVTQTLTATTTYGPVVISGPNFPFRSESDAEFYGFTDFYNTVTSNRLFQSTGASLLSDTEVLLSDNESFRVRLADQSNVNAVVNIEPPSTFESDVHFQQNITVDGNVYLSGGSSGIIRVGNEGSDKVAFDAMVTSDFLPAVADDLITPIHDIGSISQRWSELYVSKAYLDYTQSTEFIGNDLIINGSARFQTDDTNDLIVFGSGESKFYNDIVTTAQISANNGPWFFDGEDEEYPTPTESYDSDGFSYTAAAAPPPKFNVGTRSLFKSSLTALGPVQIGDLPDGVAEQLDQPTLNIYGTTVVRDGNLKIQSDIRHLDDNSTLIRFNKNRIEMHVDDESVLDAEYKDGRRQLNINTDVGVFGDNEIHNVMGRGIDLHGNMRVTETLSATNLVVDYLTVIEQSSGNVGGGLGGSNFRALSGTSLVGATTTHQHSGDLDQTTYNGIDSGVEFDILLDDTRDIQKTYSVTFKAKTNDVALGVNVGDTQTVTYQFAVSWDTTFTEAIVNDVEFGIVHTSTHPFANITAVVLTANDVPYNDRIVKLVVESQADCDFYIHNVLTQDRPERIDAIAIRDLDVAGDLKVHNDQYFDKLVHIIGTESRLEVDGNAEIHGDLTVDGNLYLSAGADGIINLGNTSGDNIAFTGELQGDIVPTEDETSDIGSDTKRVKTVYTHDINAAGDMNLQGDVHVIGNLRVDGNTYLSGGTGGIINVGDSQQDAVVFNADVQSDILPDTHNKYNLGTETQGWNNLYTNTVSANEIDTEHLISTTSMIMELSGATIHATQDAVIEGDTHAQQDLFVGGNLTVDGRINLKTTGIEENLEIDGLLIVKSFVDIGNTLSIDEDLLLSGNFTTDQNAEISGNVVIHGETEVHTLTSNNLFVHQDIVNDGDLVTNSLTATSVDASTLVISESIETESSTIHDNLTVNTVSAQGVSTDYLNVTGITDVEHINATSADIQGNTTIDGDMHITGDIRVDGNAYLSAAEGVINVGDHADDNVVFNAGIASDLIPESTGVYNLGTTNLKWNNIFIQNDADVHGDMSVHADTTVHGELSATSIIWGTDGYTSADLDRVLQYFDASQGAYGFAHLTAHWNTNINRPVLRDDELPDKAIGMTHSVTETDSVQNPNVRDKVFEGHFVHVNSTGQTLVALKDNPNGVFQTGTKTYTDYLDLSTPYDVVRKVNNVGGPNVFLTTDDISDANDNNKFVTQQQIDKFTQTSEDLSDNTPVWNDTKTVVQTYSADWEDASTVVETYSADWSAGTDDVVTIVQSNSASWIKNVDDTKYALSVKTQILNRGSIYLSSPDDSPEFLAMQSGNIGGDATWDELTYDNAMLLPLDTYVREVIIRSENAADTRVVVGVHTNQHIDTTGSKEYKYFDSTPIETKAIVFENDNEPQALTFSSHASAGRLSNLGVSVSADQPLGQSSVTIVYDYVDGDVDPPYREPEKTLTDLNYPTENHPPAPGSTDDGVVVGDDGLAIGALITTDQFTLSGASSEDLDNEQQSYTFLRSVDYKPHGLVITPDRETMVGYSKVVGLDFSYSGSWDDTQRLYIFGHVDRSDSTAYNDMLMYTRVRMTGGTGGIYGEQIKYINGVSKVKLLDHGLRSSRGREMIYGEVDDWRVIQSPIEYLPAPVKDWDNLIAGKRFGSGFLNYWTSRPSGSEVSHNGSKYESRVNHTSKATNEPGVGTEWTRYWKSTNTPSNLSSWQIDTVYTGDWADLTKVISYRSGQATKVGGLGTHYAYTAADNYELSDVYWLANASAITGGAVDGDVLSVNTNVDGVYPENANELMGSLGSDVTHLEGEYIDNTIEYHIHSAATNTAVHPTIKRWWIKDTNMIDPSNIVVKITGHDGTLPSAWINNWVLSADKTTLTYYAWKTHLDQEPTIDTMGKTLWKWDGIRRSNDTTQMNLGVESASVAAPYRWPAGSLVPANVQTGDGLWTT